jgi:homeobox protein ESX1
MGKEPETPKTDNPAPKASENPPARPKEIGGPTGPEPTRYGDWERNGRVSDF